MFGQLGPTVEEGKTERASPVQGEIVTSVPRGLRLMCQKTSRGYKTSTQKPPDDTSSSTKKHIKLLPFDSLDVFFLDDRAL